MKTSADLYTKIVLTVIAVALIGHLVKDITLVEKAYAADLPLPTPTAIKTDGVVDVNIVQIDGKSIEKSKIPVQVKNYDFTERIPIRIESSSSSIDVRVSNSPSVSVSNWP
ncbi:hypothetical protein [Dysgonomonas sp. Marseille-P4361]|uniref:hypothetical protein n=1 Tax=Dysgonomonas sp. Marseille-P4361 TaxID=2161820 RepID=UPI000D54BD1B|nr:hypothetical protein [Dysgonomonas sp. Marseille-P4361]